MADNDNSAPPMQNAFPTDKPADQPHRPQGRAAAIGLTREQVLKAGVALIDELGVEGFSIRELSRRLEVYPAAIYWHLDKGKDDLLSELTATITTDIVRVSETQGDWRDQLRLFAHRYRHAAQQHPHLANLIGAQLRANGPAHATLSEMLLRLLRQAGLDGTDMIDAMNMLIGSLFGYVTMELAPIPAKRDPDWGKQFHANLENLDEQNFPETKRVLPLLSNKAFALRWSNGTEVPLDGGYARLVEALIHSLEVYPKSK